MTDHDNFGGDVMARVSDPNYVFRPVQPAADEQAPADDLGLHWHGDTESLAPRSWLIADLVPETGSGLLSAQWGLGKTFAALDLSASVMTGTPFAGRNVARQGGVLFVAAEGASEVPVRLRGLAEHKLGLSDADRLPFAWVEDASLKSGFARLLAQAKAAAAGMEARFGVPLALVVVDTMNAAAEFTDVSDNAEGQKVMNKLNELSRKTGAFVLAVDHFGKSVGAGTMGAASKEGAADVVLAVLADRDISGAVSNARMAVRKLRGGVTGTETPFALKVVPVGDDTTCIVDWSAEAVPMTEARDRWPKSARVLKAALLEVLITEGEVRRPFGFEGPEVKTAPLSSVRREFYASYPGEQDAKRMAFKRGLDAALKDGLIASREIDGEDHLWIVHDDPGGERTEQNPRGASRSFAHIQSGSPGNEPNEQNAALGVEGVRSDDMPTQIDREDTIAAVLDEDAAELPESEEHKKRVASVRTKAWRRNLKFASQPGIPGVPSFLILPQDDGKALFASDDLEEVEAWLRDHAKPQRRGGEAHHVEG